MNTGDINIAVEPDVWASINQSVGTDYKKVRYEKLPVQSLNPLMYKHEKLYSEDKVKGLMKAAKYDGYVEGRISIEQENTELKAHINSLREALLMCIDALPDLIVNTESEYVQNAENYKGYPNLAYKYDYLKDEYEEGNRAVSKVIEVLNNIPTQSLAEHDRKVIAEFRAKCEEAGHIVINQHTGEKYFSIFENTAFGYFPVYTLPPIDNEEK